MTSVSAAPRQLSDGNSQGIQVGAATNVNTGTTDKVGFFGATPIVQPTSPAGNTTTVAAGSTTTVFTNTSFSGGVGSQGYTVGDLVAALKNLGLIAS